jgi:dCTP deaminase
VYSRSEDSCWASGIIEGDMSFFASESLSPILEQLIKPAQQDRLKRGAYELSLGPEVYDTTDKIKKDVGKQLEIPPGQFALLLTHEVVMIPKNMIGFISIKANTKFRGLVNVSGFHVDPGFHGRLKFSVYNAGSSPIILSKDKPLFLIWFCSLDRETSDFYNGDKNDQMGISDDDVMHIRGKIASPSALDERLEKVEKRIKFYNKIFWVVLIGIVVGALSSNLGDWLEKKISPPAIVDKFGTNHP